MPECDHTSVGILVIRDGKLLLIDRKRPPFGFAPPAGHVDEHGSAETSEKARYREAARAELKEEVGLTATSLELVVEGRQDNSCRRGGSWHYWRIYKAEVEGELSLAEDEVKGHTWYPLAEVKNKPDLESVWKAWFSELEIKP